MMRYRLMTLLSEVFSFFFRDLLTDYEVSIGAGIRGRKSLLSSFIPTHFSLIQFNIFTIDVLHPLCPVRCILSQLTWHLVKPQFEPPTVTETARRMKFVQLSTLSSPPITFQINLSMPSNRHLSPFGAQTMV